MTEDEIHEVQFKVQHSKGGFTPLKFAHAILEVDKLKAQPVTEPIGVMRAWGVEWSKTYSAQSYNGMKLYAAPQPVQSPPLHSLNIADKLNPDGSYNATETNNSLS